MPKSALPKNYKLGPDNESWLMRQKKKVQIWLAAGPRVPNGFFKWREMPKILFGLFGKGELRCENTNGTKFIAESELSFPCLCCDNYYDVYLDSYYLSRIQPWSRWGIVLQWPLFFNCWFIYRKTDVVSPPRYKSAFGIKKMFTFGIGFKRDSDKIYWLTTNLGGNFE